MYSFVGLSHTWWKLLEHDQSKQVTDPGSTSAFRTVFASFECSHCIQVKKGTFQCGCSIQGLPGKGCEHDTPVLHLFRLRTGMWRKTVLLGCGGIHISPQELFVVRMCCGIWGEKGFWVSTKVALTWDPEKIRSSSCEICLKQVKNQSGERIMWDSWVLSPGPVQLLLNSVEFYQLIQWECSQYWMLLYLWLCLRRDRSSFTFTSLYYNKAPHKGS